MYMSIAVRLAVYVRPGVLNPERHWKRIEGQATGMPAAGSLLGIVGLRNLLQPLPMLLRQVIRKTLWLASVPLPQWMAGTSGRIAQAFDTCVHRGRAVYPALPWRHVPAQCVKVRGGRWM
jgi:hypothetical protein